MWKITKPTPEQLDIAIEWLSLNEGEGEEREACDKVAAWLINQRVDMLLKAAAKEAGLPVALLRRRIGPKTLAKP